MEKKNFGKLLKFAKGCSANALLQNNIRQISKNIIKHIKTLKTIIQ